MKTMLDIFVHMFHSIIGFLLCLQERKCVSIRAAIFCVYLQSHRPNRIASSASSAPSVLIYSFCIHKFILQRKSFFTYYMSSLQVLSSRKPIQEDTGVIYMHGIIVICLCISFHVIHGNCQFQEQLQLTEKMTYCCDAYSHLETKYFALILGEIHFRL